MNIFSKQHALRLLRSKNSTYYFQTKDSTQNSNLSINCDGESQINVLYISHVLCLFKSLNNGLILRSCFYHHIFLGNKTACFIRSSVNVVRKRIRPLIDDVYGMFYDLVDHITDRAAYDAFWMQVREMGWELIL